MEIWHPHVLLQMASNLSMTCVLCCSLHDQQQQEEGLQAEADLLHPLRVALHLAKQLQTSTWQAQAGQAQVQAGVCSSRYSGSRGPQALVVQANPSRSSLC